MRRRIALTSVLGLLLAGFGCKHVAGKTDCQWQPGDWNLPSPTPPYVAVPATEPKGIALPTSTGGKTTTVGEKKPGNE